MAKKKTFGEQVSDGVAFATFDQEDDVQQLTAEERDGVAQLAKKAVNGAAGNEGKVDRDWDKLRKLEAEATHFEGVIAHHKEEAKAAREAWEATIKQMRDIITGQKSLPLYDRDNVEEREEDSEEAGPTL